MAAPAVLFTAAPASPPAAPALPRSVTVATSRGEFVLRVHAPGPSTEAGAAGAEPRPAILMVSGEGGWRAFDELLAGILQERGFWVGGVDAMKYFWSPQDDRRALSADMRAFAEALLKEAGRPAGAPIILAGYSFGADLAPWIAGEGSWKGRVRGIVMVGPDETGSLEFRVLEVLGLSDPTEHSFPVAAALRDCAGIPSSVRARRSGSLLRGRRACPGRGRAEAARGGGGREPPLRREGDRAARRDRRGHGLDPDRPLNEPPAGSAASPQDDAPGGYEPSGEPALGGTGSEAREADAGRRFLVSFLFVRLRPFWPWIVLAVLTVVGWEELRRIDVTMVRGLLRSTEPRLILALLAATAFNLAVAGLYDVLALGPLSRPPRAAVRWSIGLISFAWSNFLTLGPLAGPGLRFWLYAPHRVGGPRARSALGDDSHRLLARPVRVVRRGAPSAAGVR